MATVLPIIGCSVKTESLTQVAVAKVPPLSAEIVKRSDKMKGFVVLPRRWMVERTFSWFGRNRRLAKDF
jgi:transposase